MQPSIVRPVYNLGRSMGIMQACAQVIVRALHVSLAAGLPCTRSRYKQVYFGWPWFDVTCT
jgi:hypothetical protein